MSEFRLKGAHADCESKEGSLKRKRRKTSLAANLTMELSIVLVNWNSVDYLRECLTSIYAQTRGIDFEVIVVDNASSDGQARSLKAEFPQVTLIESDHNLGFAGANNLGFKCSSGEHILFLNPDTKVVGPAITAMVDQLRLLPDAGIVGCKLLNSDLSIQTTCIQRFPTISNQMLDIEALRLRLPHLRFWGIAPLFANPERPTEVEVVTGACLMIKRDVFEKVGGFNQEYFMYAEDVDLCYKVHQAGWKGYYIGDACIIHYGGGSSRQREQRHWATIMQRKAVLKFFQKTRGRVYAWMFRAALGLSAFCRLLVIPSLYVVGKTQREREDLSFAFTKYVAILGWVVGLERQTLGLNDSCERRLRRSCAESAEN